MDTELRVTHPSLELQRTEIPQTLMQPLAIIEPFEERKEKKVESLFLTQHFPARGRPARFVVRKR